MIWGLRDYGVEGQLGLEATPEEYVAKMVAVFAEVKRVLKDEGTLWLNLGDSYNSTSGFSRADEQWHRDGRDGGANDKKAISHSIIKPKDLCGIPWRVAFALQADGWYLRQDIIWHKPNPMPESVRDRCTKAHEYIFLLTKSAKYYYDSGAVKEAFADERRGNPNGGGQYSVGSGRNDSGVLKTGKWNEDGSKSGRNLRSVWTITTKPYRGAHFATFPPEIPERCVKAGSKEGDIVLDPFAGAGTTVEVAKRLGRDYIGIELNEKYVKELIEPRLEAVGPLFKEAG